MIEFTFKDDENFLYVKRKGDINSEDILNVIDAVNASYEHKKHLYILQDTSESFMKYKIEDLSVMIDKIKKRLEKFELVKIANFTNNPLETATAFIFENMAKHIDKLIHQTFSTEENAKLFLKKDMIRD